MRYVKSSGIAGHHFDSWGEMESHLECWNREIADQRIDGTTGEQACSPAVLAGSNILSI